MKLKGTVHFDWYKKLFLVLLVGIGLTFSIYQTDADIAQVIRNSNQMVQFFSRFLEPDISYFNQIMQPLLITIQMSVVGTFLGVVIAVPIAFLATTVITENPVISFVFRFLLSIVRTIPTLLLGAFLVAVFGIGAGTGVLTIAIFTFGMVSQLIFEAIENIDYDPIEAMTAVGANKLKVIFWGVIPQVFVYIVSYSLYAFEVNIRASLVLGYVGAGGVGVLINTAMSLSRYDRVAVIVFVIFVVIICIDRLSEFVRARLL
jgi:phosphonate transport system permease protein